MAGSSFIRLTWSHACNELGQVHAWLSTAVLSPGGVDPGALRSQLGRVNSVVLVLRALAAPAPAPPAAAPPAAAAPEAPRGGDLEAALRLQQCLQVRRMHVTLICKP